MKEADGADKSSKRKCEDPGKSSGKKQSSDGSSAQKVTNYSIFSFKFSFQSQF